MNKSRIIFALLVLIGLNTLNAQVKSVKVGDNPTIINRSAALEVESLTKGILIPRLALTGPTDTTTIVAGNVTSLLVYNTATVGGLTPGYHYWSGTAWVRIVSSDVLESLERDGIVGNEVLDATPNRGLVRTGAGTVISPYTLGLPVGATSGQLITWNGTNWVPLAPADGIIGNEITDVVPNRGLLRSGAGTDADKFRIGLVNGQVVGQILKWDGTNWILSPDANNNIYNTDGTLTSDRVVTMGNNDLIFAGATGDKIELQGPMTLTHKDEFVINANSDNLGETDDLILQVSGVDYLHIRNGTGNVGLSTNGPTQKLDVNGNARIRLMADGTDKGRFSQQVVIDGDGILGRTTLVADLDTFVGNEVTDVTPNRGLVRSGLGTDASKYTIGLIDGTASGQVLQWNGAGWGLVPNTGNNIYNSDGTLSGGLTTVAGVTGNFRTITLGSTAGVVNGLAIRGDATASLLLQGPKLANWADFVINANADGGATIPTGTTEDIIFQVRGNEYARIKDGGNVGIGTNNPQARLDIRGTIRITDGSQGAGRILTSDVNGLATWSAPSAAVFTEQDAVVGNEVVDATPNGGLVRSGAGAVGNVYTLGLTPGTTQGQAIVWNGTSWAPAAIPSSSSFFKATLTGPAVVSTATGSIGTTTATIADSAATGVQGTNGSFVIGNNVADTAVKLLVNGSAKLGRLVTGVAGNTTDTSLIAFGGISVQGNIGLGPLVNVGTTGQVITSAGTTGLTSWSDPVNIYNANGTLTANRVLTQTATANSLTIARNVAGTSGEANNGYATLNIGGTANDPTAFNTGGRIQLTGFAGGTNATIAGYEEAAPNAGRYLSLKAGLAAANNGLYLNTSGAVGINTPKPNLIAGFNSNSLEITDTTGGALSDVTQRAIGTTGTPTYNFIAHNGTTAAPAVSSPGRVIGLTNYVSSIGGQNFAVAASIRAVIEGNATATSLPGRLDFLTTPTGTTTPVARITINNNGNVGIGTVGPAAKLDIIGKIKITDGSEQAGRILTSDANGLATWTAPAAVTASSNLYTADGTIAGGLSTVANVVGNFRTITLGAGNGLAIRGDATASFLLQGPKLASWSDLVLNANADGTAAGTEEIVFQVRGTEYARIKDGGNMGIGINPTEKLDVNGKVKVRDLAVGTATDDIVTVNATGVLQKRSIADIITTSVKKVRTLATSFALAPDDDIIVFNGTVDSIMTIPTTGVQIGKTWSIANITTTTQLNYNRPALNPSTVGNSVSALGSVTIAIVSNTGDYVVISGF